MYKFQIVRKILLAKKYIKVADVKMPSLILISNEKEQSFQISSFRNELTFLLLFLISKESNNMARRKTQLKSNAQKEKSGGNESDTSTANQTKSKRSDATKSNVLKFSSSSNDNSMEKTNNVDASSHQAKSGWSVSSGGWAQNPNEVVANTSDNSNNEKDAKRIDVRDVVQKSLTLLSRVRNEDSNKSLKDVNEKIQKKSNLDNKDVKGMHYCLSSYVFFLERLIQS